MLQSYFKAPLRVATGAVEACEALTDLGPAAAPHDDGTPRDDATGYFVLKVEPRWLQRIYEAKPPYPTPKRIEVRKYPVGHHAPKGEDRPQVGERVHLAAGGRLWGAATIT